MIKGGVDTTIKFLIYLLIFLIVVLAFVFLFVIPGIKDYQSAKSEYSFNSQKYDNLLIEQKELISQLELVKNENKKIIDRFAKKFDINEFKIFSKKYFDDVKLTKINSDSNSTALKVYQFSAQIKAQNPKQFYNFVKDLDTYDGLAKINFPINISSQNTVLKIDFHMSVYSMITK
ncbi:MAG TPA: hypothetical protein EYG75_00810 [Campylobacterales bacterium]|nr:hypothetical protein [Campylobacterales bacterium]